MSSRASLNKVLLIGNLTRDPELRYTPSGAAVCSFTIATNRVYVASDGNKKEETEFTRVVSWNKLAELCSQLLTKGRKVYVEGRLQTRSWDTPDGQTRQQTEVIIDDMRILDSRKVFEEGGLAEVAGAEASTKAANLPDKLPEELNVNDLSIDADKAKAKPGKKEKVEKAQAVDLSDDLPF